MKGFLNALGFLTIVKIPARYCYLKDFSPALLYFPLIGFLLGAAVAFLFWALNLILPAAAAAILAVGLEAVLTGGLHYDGLADVFDGVFSGKRDKEKILNIMKKSDIGTFGVMAVVFMLLLKIAAIYYLYTLLGSNIWLFAAVICFMPAIGRWAMVYLLGSYRPARKEGSLAAMFVSDKNRRQLFVSTFYTVVAFLGLVYLSETVPGQGYTVLCSGAFYRAAAYLVPLLKAAVVFLASFLVLGFAGQFFSKRLGGINGDILGAASVIIEVFYLFSFLILFTFL
ncbi:MAG: adenosylcobinamide-GDP ribazoletransferase [Actinomycetota bacterium]